MAGVAFSVCFKANVQHSACLPNYFFYSSSFKSACKNCLALIWNFDSRRNLEILISIEAKFAALAGCLRRQYELAAIKILQI
jgi:hypothetical protein